jgi:cytochrome P450
MMEETDLSAWEPAFTAEHYPCVARLREQSAASRVIIDGLPAWLITRYEHVRAALADPRLSVNPDLAGPAARAVPWVAATGAHDLTRHLLRTDPPEHTRLRRLAAQAFTPDRVERMRPRIQQIANDLIAAFRPNGHADLVSQFAIPVSMNVIGEIYGVPAADRDELARLITIYGGVNQGDLTRMPEILTATWDFLSALVKDKQRRVHPATEDGDLLDGLIAARDDGVGLIHDELVAMSFGIVASGFSPTVGLIGNGVLALLRNPDQLAMLRAAPDLIGPAVEEFLRHDGPLKVSATIRFATQDVPFGDVVIPAGDPVFFSYAAADRDPRHFASPDRLDIRRANSGGHVAFSDGMHYCMGAPLARAEAQIAISALLAACPDLALATDPAELSWRQSRQLRGLKSLPVTFTAVPADR